MTVPKVLKKNAGAPTKKSEKFFLVKGKKHGGGERCMPPPPISHWVNMDSISPRYFDVKNIITF